MSTAHDPGQATTSGARTRRTGRADPDGRAERGDHLPGDDQSGDHLPDDRRRDREPATLRTGSHAPVDHPTADGATTQLPAGDRRAVVAAQKERFGGVKWGSAFFGWLTATGTAVLLTALVAAAGIVVGAASSGQGAGAAVDQATRAAQDPATARTVGIIGVVVLLAVLFLSYFCGGYVAGRMARFNGLKQGVAVWIWAVAAAAVAAVLGAVAGSRFQGLAGINGLPGLPVDLGALTTSGIITALLALVAALVGAALGGLTGMRFHRRVDRAGFEQ